MLVITHSGYKDPEGKVIRDKDVALKEGTMAANLIGVELICLNYETWMVPFDEPLTSKIRNYIEKLEIDTIYAHWIHDLHRDHQFTGKATLMAGRQVPRFLMFCSNFYDTERQFQGNFYSDISDVMDKKIEVIKTNKSELERVGYRWLDFYMNKNENDGKKIGVKYAECFETIRYLI